MNLKDIKNSVDIVMHALERELVLKQNGLDDSEYVQSTVRATRAMVYAVLIKNARTKGLVIPELDTIKLDSDACAEGLAKGDKLE